MLKAVINPAGAAGGTLKTWEKAQRILKAAGAQCEVYFSTAERSVTDIVRTITDTDEEMTLLVFGGDGTMNLAVNGIRDFDLVKVGYIPCGSGNDLAKALSISDDLETLIARVLENNIVRTIDVGETVIHRLYDSEDHLICDTDIIRRFNISSGIGFDAEICANVESSNVKKVLNKVRAGKLSYISEALKVIFNAPRAKTEMVLDDVRRMDFDKLLFTVGMNTCYEGGGFRFAPEADPSDGMLDLCAADHLSRFDFFRMFPYAYSGAHVKFKGVTIEKCRSVRIRTDIPLWLHADGEVLGRSDDITLRISGKKMRMVI